MTYTPQSPGVYVYEKATTPSIAGVGTSTAGFIGIVSDTENHDQGGNSVTQVSEPEAKSTQPTVLKNDEEELKASANGLQKKFEFSVVSPFGQDKSAYIFFREGDAPDDSPIPLLFDQNTFSINGNEAEITFTDAIPGSKKILATYQSKGENKDELAANHTTQEQSQTEASSLAKAQEIKLCTNFTEFKTAFGDPAKTASLSNLAHAVYGFFANGGTRCYVAYANDTSGIDDILEDFAAIDEIAIVAAPGAATIQGQLITHCTNAKDRFAILDSPEVVSELNNFNPEAPSKSDYAAYYFPWIEVSDLANSAEKKYVPPSGHIAGIYARVDAQRGVHKAPANEVIFGATGLKYVLSRAKQDGLNPKGINCIRNLNGNIRVWGARTWSGGDGVQYISTRRLLNYIRESIDEGTQWVVFEPNSPELWAKVRREVTAFLTTVWRSGALFGATPQEAFFIQCDEETNPPEQRALGQLNAKVGVAIVKPAEFVIFELSQWSGGN